MRLIYASFLFRTAGILFSLGIALVSNYANGQLLGPELIVNGSFGTVAADGINSEGDGTLLFGINAYQPNTCVNPGVTVGKPLPAGQTTYRWDFGGEDATISAACSPPTNDSYVNDGGYALVTATTGMFNLPNSPDLWVDIQDNGPEADGYFLLVNAGAPTDPGAELGIFYKRDVTLAPGQTYRMSADLTDLIISSAGDFSPAKVGFVTAPTGTSDADLSTIASFYNTGDMGLNTWNTYQANFTPGCTTSALTIAFRDEQRVSNGGDLGADNLSVRAYSPQIDATISTSGTDCEAVFDLTGDFPVGQYNYLWQRETAISGVWANMGTSVNYSATQPGTYRLRLTTATTTACPMYSNIVIVENTGEGCLSLPVTLSSFNVKKEGLLATLNWSTTEESNSDRFEIERSNDAKSWLYVGQKAAIGESKVKVNYSFTDNTPLSGVTYYRLKMVDIDGSTTYSRRVSISANALTSAYPNPASGNIFLPEFEKIKSASLVSTSGKTILKASSINAQGLNVRQLKGGIYILKVEKKDGSVSTEKIVLE